MKKEISKSRTKSRRRKRGDDKMLPEYDFSVRDALAAVIEAYQDLGRTLPPNTQLNDVDSAIWLETVV